MQREKTRKTRIFYNRYRRQNEPDYRRTREHIFSLSPDSSIKQALDAGAGTGVCSRALAEQARALVGVNASGGSLRVAWELASEIRQRRG